MKKFILRIIPVLAVLAVILTTSVWPVFAANNNKETTGENRVDDLMEAAGGNSVETVDYAVQRIWGTVLTILQIAGVAAIVFAGVKYMFASAENRAEIKQGMIGLVVGAILVFGASTIIKFILKVQSDVGL